MAQYTDPAVSRVKFDREVAEFRSMAGEYRRRGWLLVEAEFPRVVIVLATPKVKPSAIVTGVLFDYTNYDASPPSVRLIHPFTGEVYRASELPTQLMRSLPARQIAAAGMPEAAPQLTLQAQQPLMQAHVADEIPFLCLAGVTEYHEHPAHSGDAWELHRTAGAGRLVRLVGIISKYGLDTITGFNVQLVPTVGFNFGPPPP